MLYLFFQVNIYEKYFKMDLKAAHGRKTCLALATFTCFCTLPIVFYGSSILHNWPFMYVFHWDICSELDRAFYISSDQCHKKNARNIKSTVLSCTLGDNVSPLSHTYYEIGRVNWAHSPAWPLTSRHAIHPASQPTFSFFILVSLCDVTQGIGESIPACHLGNPSLQPCINHL